MPESFPANKIYSQLDTALNTEESKLVFYKVVKALPNLFLENNIWIKQILNGEILNEDETIERLRSQHLNPQINAEKLKEIWIVFIPSEEHSDDLNELPLNRLKLALLWAERAREVLNKINEINNSAHRAIYFSGISVDRMLKDEVSNLTSLYIDHNGEIRFSAWYPINILMDERTDTRRIKKCVRCKNFYWAKRINNKINLAACENCSNLLRQQKFQAKNKEDINRRRRQNYYIKNNIYYCDVCVFPFEKYNCTSVECSCLQQESK